MLTGELSKGASPGTSIHATQDPKQLRGLDRLSMWQGCCVILVPPPKQPQDQDSQHRSVLPELVSLGQYLLASVKPHHCGCLASRTLQWTGERSYYKQSNENEMKLQE